MSIISANNLSYNVGVETILEDVSFVVNKGDKVGIVGVNGAGKSTLLKLIVREIEEDSGELNFSKDISIGYLRQREHFEPHMTVLEAVMKDDASRERFEENRGYSYEAGAKGILVSMGFDPSYYDKRTGLLSGGEKTRLALAALLLQEPDVLLLDEPTNHLDIPTLRWLENYLKGYRGTLLIVSHDRYFLDKTVTRIFEIENRRLTAYNGNYSSYKEQKQRNFEIELKHYEHAMEEIRRQEDMIRRFKERKTELLVRRAQSREKRLARIERPVRPTMLKESLKLHFDQTLVSGNDVVTGRNLSYSYPGSGRVLFENVELDIKKGDRICIVGANGVGKTTLLKIIIGRLSPDKGRVLLGTNVMPGYYDQEQKNLSPEATVLDEIHSQYIRYNAGDLRNILGGLLFCGDDVFKRVKDLAGGEKARLSLLKLMMSGCNLLIFDEPTNHLDISAKEVFEEAISSFPGTVIIVSHDRYLLSRVPTAIFELTPEGINKYLGNYDYYEEHEQERKALRPTAVSGGAGGSVLQVGTSPVKGAIGDGGRVFSDEGSYGADCIASSGGTPTANFKSASEPSIRQESWEEKKAREREERKTAKALANAEELVHELEAEIKEIEEQIEDPIVASDHELLAELAAQLEESKAALEEAMEEWLQMSEEN